MEKILIYAKNNNILIVANVTNPENCICAMTIQKNRYHFCKRYKRHYLAKRKYKKISTDNFTLALLAIDKIINKQSI